MEAEDESYDSGEANVEEEGNLEEADEDCTDTNDLMESTPPAQQHQQPLRERRCKTRETPSYLPPTVSSINPKTGPRVQRLQKSYVVRDVHSKYPTEIHFGVRQTTPPIAGNVDEPTKSYIEVIKDYFGYDPSSLLFNLIEDRILRSTEAPDESDSQHFQRLGAALQTTNKIKQTRVQNVSTLVGLGQKELNDTQQHERYSEAIAVKRDKATSEIKKEDVECHAMKFDLNLKRSQESQFGWLRIEVEANELWIRNASLAAYPTYSLLVWTEKDSPEGNFSKRLKLLRRNIR